MSRIPSKIVERASAYLGHDTLTLPLGAGIDGSVFSTSRFSAIKIFARPSTFRNELAAYKRLAAHQVTQVKGVAVPCLYGADEKLGVIEMSIVQPPCLIDFAGVYLDFPPDFTQEAWDIWLDQKEDEFESDWPRANAIYQYLIDHYGMYYLDLAPRNLRFRS